MEPTMIARKNPAPPRRPAARKAKQRKTIRRPARTSTSKRWSQRVTEESDALDLKRGVFKLTSAKKIAASLKRSAERSSRRKSGAYRSALSMLTFYINRAGKNLPKAQRERLERAKQELKQQFGKA
jgi:putative cell wall-binding protein